MPASVIRVWLSVNETRVRLVRKVFSPASVTWVASRLSVQPNDPEPDSYPEEGPQQAGKKLGDAFVVVRGPPGIAFTVQRHSVRAVGHRPGPVFDLAGVESQGGPAGAPLSKGRVQK